MLTATEREARLETARNLRRRQHSTTSEAEANACISQIRRLQMLCGLTLDEIDADGEAVSAVHFRKATVRSGAGHWNHVDNTLAFDIAKFCRVKVGTVYPVIDNVMVYHLEFFGYEADVDNATWLRATIRDAMLFEWEVYRDHVMAPTNNHRGARIQFSRGMAARLRERMNREEERDDATANAVTVRTNELVAQRAAEVGFVEAKAGRGRANVFDANAYAAGYNAGGRVNMGRGVEARTSGGSHSTGTARITKQ